MIYGFGWRKPKKELFRANGNKFPQGRFRRVGVDVKSDDTGEVFAGRVFLTDLKPDEVSIFLEAPLEKGERISLVLDHPERLYVKGEVTWCVIRTLNMRVISVDDFRYRVHVKFQFDSVVEADAVKLFCSVLPG